MQKSKAMMQPYYKILGEPVKMGRDGLMGDLTAYEPVTRLASACDILVSDAYHVHSGPAKSFSNPFQTPNQ
jgi:hypothetical protein